MGKKRTQKQLDIEDITNVITAHLKAKNFVITVNEIIEQMTKINTTAATRSRYLKSVTADVTTVVTNYIFEACEQIKHDQNVLYHWTSQEWYSKGCPIPETKEEAQRYIVAFATGSRKGPKAGVRFSSEDVSHDLMFMVAIENDIDTPIKAFDTHTQRIDKTLSSSLVNKALQQEMQDKVKRLQ